MRRIKDYVQFTARFPPDLTNRIKERASVMNRSFSAELQTLAEAALAAEDAANAKVAESLSRSST